MGKELPGVLLIRKTIRDYLEKAQFYLQQDRPKAKLLVTHGFRTLELQTKWFLRELEKEVQKGFISDPIELYDRVHRRIAVPNVAGHPTGGAVDLTIKDTTKKGSDMGCAIADFQGPIETFSPTISLNARNNRLLLRKCMMEAGFKPFDGEFWHFCHGDKEWAYLAGKDSSKFSQKTLEQAKAMLAK